MARLAETLADNDYENRVIWRTYLPHAHYALESYLVDEGGEDRIEIGTLASVSRLASVLRSRGKYEEAEKMYLRMLKGCEKALGKAHLDTLMIVNNLALVLQNQGKRKETEQMNRRALEGYEKALG